MELRLDIRKLGIESSKDVFVDVDDTSLLIRAKSDGTLKTLMNVQTLFDRIKSSETIWYVYRLVLHSCKKLLFTHFYIIGSLMRINWW